jgi:hypothetical protein
MVVELNGAEISNSHTRASDTHTFDQSAYMHANMDDGAQHGYMMDPHGSGSEFGGDDDARGGGSGTDIGQNMYGEYDFNAAGGDYGGYAQQEEGDASVRDHAQNDGLSSRHGFETPEHEQAGDHANTNGNVDLNEGDQDDISELVAASMGDTDLHSNAAGPKRRKRKDKTDQKGEDDRGESTPTGQTDRVSRKRSDSQRRDGDSRRREKRKESPVGN